MKVAFSPNIWYRLHNTSQSPLTVLDVVNDGGSSNSSGTLQLATLGNYSGQFWQLRQHLDSSGVVYYKLNTWFLGKNMCLDTQMGCKRMPCLAKADERKDRQEWIIEPSFSESHNGRKTWDANYKLKERASGKYLGLSLHGNKDELAFGEGGLGSRWVITPIQELTDPDFVVQESVMTKE